MDESLYAFPTTTRPWLRGLMVSSVDGSAEDADGLSGSLGGDGDRDVFALLRSLADVVLVSAGTARAEGYGPIDGGTLVLVSRSLDVPASLRTDGVVVLTTGDADPERAASLRRDGVQVWRAGAEEIDWAQALDLFAEHGWTRVLCEGGPSLLGTLAEQDLIDDLCLTVAPTLMAGPGRRIAASQRPVTRALRLVHAVEHRGDLLTRWVRDRTPGA